MGRPAATTLAIPTMNVAVASAGDGTPVIYLHDMLLDHVADGGDLPQALIPLSESFSVRIPSLPGFRDLGQLEQMSTVVDYVLWVGDVIKGLEVVQPHVIGTGLGGWIAAEYAVHHSSDLRTLTLVNAFGLKVEDHPTARFFVAAAPNPLGGRREVRELLFADPSSQVANSAMPDFLDDDANVRFFNSMHAAARIGWKPPTFYDPDLLGRLWRISVPTHVIWGAQNALVDVAHAEAFSRGIAGSTLTLLEGAAHAVVLEQPDELGQALTKFLLQ